MEGETPKAATHKCRSLGYGALFLKDAKAFSQMRTELRRTKIEFRQTQLLPKSFARDLCGAAGNSQKTVLYTMDMFTDGPGGARDGCN